MVSVLIREVAKGPTWVDVLADVGTDSASVEALGRAVIDCQARVLDTVSANSARPRTTVLTWLQVHSDRVADLEARLGVPVRVFDGRELAERIRHRVARESLPTVLDLSVDGEVLHAWLVEAGLADEVLPGSKASHTTDLLKIKAACEAWLERVSGSTQEGRG